MRGAPARAHGRPWRPFGINGKESEHVVVSYRVRLARRCEAVACGRSLLYLSMVVATFLCWNAAFGVVGVADEPGQRWGLEQLASWFSRDRVVGRQRPSSMDSTPPNAPRPPRGGAGTNLSVAWLVELGLPTCTLQLLQRGKVLTRESMPYHHHRQLIVRCDVYS